MQTDNTVLETPRLILRPLEPEDVDSAMAFLRDENTMRYLGGVKPESDCWRTFAAWLGMQRLTPFNMFAVVERASGQWIGRIGPLKPHSWPVREVGWGLIESAQGKGLALEAAIACIDYVFDVLDWDWVNHLIDDPNVPSQRLAERLGSEPGELVELPGSLAGDPCRIWGQTREDWRARRSTFDKLVPRASGG